MKLSDYPFPKCPLDLSDRDREISSIKKMEEKISLLREEIKKMDKELSTSVFNFNVKYTCVLFLCYHTPTTPIHWIYTNEIK